MTPPILVPCLVALRAEFDRANPARDKTTDGWRGDRVHALTSSDHNPDETGRTPYEDADFVDEVHAIDVDATGPWPHPGWFDETVEAIRARHARGIDNRLQNIIRNRRIASRSWGWTWQPYTGPSPHTEHAHFSARYTSAQEADTSPWGVRDREVTPVTITDPEVKKIADASAAAVWSHRPWRSTDPASTAVAVQRAGSLGELLDRIDDRLAAIEAAVTPPTIP